MLINNLLMFDFESVSSQQRSWDEAHPGARAGLPGGSPADAAEPSRLVSLRGALCHFLDYSFFFVSDQFS